MTRPAPLLFAYGTLRRDVRDGMAHLIAGRARFVGRGRTRGKLYDLGEYPGLVASAETGAWVRGEVFELHAPDETLAMLDDYEGCGAADEPPHEFERRNVAVRLESGATVTAAAYLYRGPIDGARPIPSGDYARPGE